jgi:hypothetical protein
MLSRAQASNAARQPASTLSSAPNGGQRRGGADSQGVLGQPDATFQGVELATTLLYQLGEGTQEEVAKAGGVALGNLALGARASPPRLERKGPFA